MIGEDKILVLIPTFNEIENVDLIYKDIAALKIKLDVLFVDDNSPDGTGKIIDQLVQTNTNVFVLHRSYKMGIGTAHQEGIAWAYTRGYKILITMDCDFTTPPAMICQLLNAMEGHDLVIGSRYILKDSLADWHMYRKFLTHLGHFLTGSFLGLKYDATGALRLYRLDRIPHDLFKRVISTGYSFFYESLFILNFNKYVIKEIPVKLPSRVYGHSKMRFKDIVYSLKLLVIIYFKKSFNRSSFLLNKKTQVESGNTLIDQKQEWDRYWSRKKSLGEVCYDSIAVFYRRYLIRPSLNFYIKKYFNQGEMLLHAGCGGGLVDEEISSYVRIIALDYSKEALNLYQGVNQDKSYLLCGSILNIPLSDHSVDGVYNLGVMEHYQKEDINKILLEFKRVLKPGKKIILFWPPEYGLSVYFMKIVHSIIQKAFKKAIKMHPDECSRLRSRKEAEMIVQQAGLKLVAYDFGLKDFFTQCVLVLEHNK